jgi:VanZ family protein
VRSSPLWFRGFWAAATVAVAAFIFYQSTGSSDDPAVPDLTTAQGYVGHVAVYTVLAFCAQTAVLPRRWAETALVVVLAAAFGAALELYQSTLDGREGSPYDALANLTGAVLGAMLALAMRRR